MILAVITLRYAMIHNFDRHRRWAMRLFLVVNGVWFFRVGLMLWVFVTGGLGIDWETFTGPFMTYWTFVQYLLPLGLLELYFYARNRAGTTGKFLIAGTLLLFTIATGTGIFMAFTKLWLPRM